MSERTRAPVEPERWLPVVDWETLYEVSSRGRVRSRERVVQTRGRGRRVFPPRVLVPSWTGSRVKYARVTLCSRDRKYNEFVHILVLRAFKGEPPTPESQARHGEHGSTCNADENLSWGTRVENERDKVRDGTANGYRVRDGHCIRWHPLRDRNLRWWGGQRVCAACSRVRNRRPRPVNEDEFQRLADIEYASICSGTTKEVLSVSSR